MRILKIERFLFVLSIILLPIAYAPKAIAFSSFGVFGTAYSIYPMILGCMILLYDIKKNKDMYKEVLAHFKLLISRYCLLYIAILTFSLIIGLFKFPYYDQVDIQSLHKIKFLIDKFPMYKDILNGPLGIAVILFIKNIKVIIGNVCIPAVLVMWILCIYKKNWKLLFNDMWNGIFISLSIMISYSVVEYFQLTNHEWARNFLVQVNPYIHEITTKAAYGDWWPPLLWMKRMRSVCEEPSFLGIVFAMFVPIFVASIFRRNRKIVQILLFFFFFCIMIMLMASQSKTGLVIAIAYVILLCILFRKKFKKLIVCGLVLMIGVGVGLQITNTIKQDYIFQHTSPAQITAAKYVKNNVIGAGNVNAGSNTARYSLIYADLQIFKQNPILGVGEGLLNGYVTENIPQWGKKSAEVQMWIKRQKERNILGSGYTCTNQYTRTLATNGFISLIMLFLPLGYVLYKVKKLLKKMKMKEQEYVGVVIIALISILIAMLAGRLFLSYYFLLTFLLCYLYSKEGQKT